VVVTPRRRLMRCRLPGSYSIGAVDFALSDGPPAAPRGWIPILQAATRTTTGHAQFAASSVVTRWLSRRRWARTAQC